jgi:hypothetical protein
MRQTWRALASVRGRRMTEPNARRALVRALLPYVRGVHVSAAPGGHRPHTVATCTYGGRSSSPARVLTAIHPTPALVCVGREYGRNGGTSAAGQ